MLLLRNQSYFMGNEKNTCIISMDYTLILTLRENVSGNSYAGGTQIVSCLSHGKDRKQDSLHTKTYNDFVILSVLSQCSNEIQACYICHTTLLISFLFI